MTGKLVKAETSCSRCGEVDRVFAVPQIADSSRVRRLWAFCPNERTDRTGHQLEHPYLTCDEYLAEFPELASDKDRRPAKYRISRARRYEILQRDGYRCVFCRIRLEQYSHPGDAALSDPQILAAVLEAERIARVATPVPVGEVLADGQFEGTVADLEDRALFVADADHLYPVDWLGDMAEAIDEADRRRILRKCAKDWLVATCPDCNGGRYWNPDSPRTMLGVYARHLFTNKPDDGAYEDLADFITALKVYAFMRQTRTMPTRKNAAG
jgi:hypothetical protein